MHYFAGGDLLHMASPTANLTAAVPYKLILGSNLICRGDSYEHNSSTATATSPRPSRRLSRESGRRRGLAAWRSPNAASAPDIDQMDSKRSFWLIAVDCNYFESSNSFPVDSFE